MNISQRCARVLTLMALLLGSGRPALRASDSEDELKAAAVWLFVQYSHLVPGPDGAVTVGVVGRSSFGQTLRRTLEGKSIGGRPVRVADSKPDLHCCQVIYLATDKADEIRRILLLAQPVRTLTIGESDRFLELGGAVSLFLSDGHIAFETSLNALDRCGITISANLLKFGQIRDRGKGAGVK